MSIFFLGKDPSSSKHHATMDRLSTILLDSNTTNPVLRGDIAFHFAFETQPLLSFEFGLHPQG